MQQVDHYLRQAKAAHELAAATDSETMRTQFQQIAATWEELAKERLSLLQLKIDRLGSDAIVMPDTMRERAEPSSGMNGHGM
jgi:hypothetical protein